MPSEKFKISKASRSIRHAAQNFFGTFSVSPNASQTTSVSYPIVGGNIPASIQEDPETHLDRRSAHNALERQRRETLNSKFQELAHALPALQTIRRPSKTMIVAKSLDYVTKSIQRESSYVNQIKDLRKQNERLRKQAKAAKAMMMKQQQQIAKKKSSSTSSASTASSHQPMTPPLSTVASSCTMQRNSTNSTSLSSQHPQQMSPPLTPETPTKQRIDLTKQSPAVNATWSDSNMMLMTSPLPTQINSHRNNNNINNNPPPPMQADMMMMPPANVPQWTPSSDMMLMQSAHGYYMNSTLYSQQDQPIMYHHQPANNNNNTVATTAAISEPNHFMTYNDTINPMLFSPYQWQDHQQVYHQQEKQVGHLYLA